MTLPPLFPLSTCGGHWQTYEDALYQEFQALKAARLSYRGLRLSYRTAPLHKDKESSFWHLTSEGPDEQTRTPDLERCERLPWVAPIIAEGSRADGINGPVRWYENRRGAHTNVVLWLHAEDYAVVLSKRDTYALLVTAYCLAPRRAERFEREWQEFWQPP